MAAPETEFDAVVTRLARAAERLRAEPAPPPPAELSAEQALARLREACEGLRSTDLELRRARTQIARLAAEAAALRPPREAA